MIAGIRMTEIDRMMVIVDRLALFGTLVAAGHDRDRTRLRRHGVAVLARDLMPIMNQHEDSLRP